LTDSFDAGTIAAMSVPEQPAAGEERTPKSRSSGQPLYLRMYFQRHMTDVVRAMRYDVVSNDEGRRRMEPLIAQYGKEFVADAVQELVEGTSSGCFQLTEHARRLARGILGPPPSLSVAPAASEIVPEVPSAAQSAPVAEPPQLPNEEASPPPTRERPRARTRKSSKNSNPSRRKPKTS
jgi:hypothetical protein